LSGNQSFLKRRFVIIKGRWGTRENSPWKKKKTKTTRMSRERKGLNSASTLRRNQMTSEKKGCFQKEKN